MQLTKLRALREGHRRVAITQLERVAAETSDSEKRRIIAILSSKAVSIRELNEKIVNHNDTEDIAGELFEGEDYIIGLEAQIDELRCSLQPTETSRRAAREQDHRELRTLGESADDSYTHEEQSNNASSRDPEGAAGSTSNRGTGETEHANVSRAKSFHSSSYHKLPKLQMPEFDGEIEEWQTFWDSYESAIHSNPTLSDVQKFTYLRSILHGSASSAIAGFPLTNANYKNAIDLLKQRFGQPHKIRAKYMKSMLDLQTPEHSVIGLRAFHDKIESCIRGLESLGQRHDSYGDLLVPVILEKLPGEVRRNLAREHGGDSSWSLPDLQSSIGKEISILEAGEPRESRTLCSPTASFHTGSRQYKPSRDKSRSEEILKTANPKAIRQLIRTCIFCEGTHSATNCNQLTDVEKRKGFVQSKRLCYNCLGTHRVSDCKSTNRCRNCRRKHHTAICDQQTQSKLNPEATPFQAERGHQDIEALHGLHLHSTDLPRPSVLLKTAISEVCSSHTSTDANILFDEGSQRSFITKKLADDLQIQPSGTEAINLATFGDTTQRLRHPQSATVSLKTTGGGKINMDVLIVPTIAAPLSNIPPEVAKLGYLKGLTLAHPVSKDSIFEIELLIGADNYWRIVQNHVVKGNGPTAVKSKLGYLLSGPITGITKKTQHAMLSVFTSPLEVVGLEKFSNMESVGIEHVNDKTPTRYLKDNEQDSVTFKGDRHSCELSWKGDIPVLRTNRQMDGKSSHNITRRPDPPIPQTCDDIHAKQKKRGYRLKTRDSNSSLADRTVHNFSHLGVEVGSVSKPVSTDSVYRCNPSAVPPACLTGTQRSPYHVCVIRLGDKAASTQPDSIHGRRITSPFPDAMPKPPAFRCDHKRLNTSLKCKDTLECVDLCRPDAHKQKRTPLDHT